MTTSLRTLLPLMVLLLGLSVYGFISAQATPAPSNPPNSNADAPINTGSEPQTKLGLFGVDGMTIATGSPSIKFHDTTSGAAKYWLYNNSNYLYVLADRDGSGGSWDAAPFPMVMLASTTAAGDFVRFSGAVRADDVCDYNGANCFTPSDVVPVDTTGFINTSATAQSKAGSLTLTGAGILTATNLYTAGNVRTANICDAAGANCTAPSAVINNTATAQTKTGAFTSSGIITGSNLYTAGNVRTANLCDAAGANCTTPATILDTTATAQTKTGNLTIGGTVTATTFLYSSDERLKHDIKTAPGLDIVQNLRGVSFKWNESENPDYGFIAQEIEAILPDLVEKNSEGYYAVEYANLLPFLVEAIKEQQVQIDELEARLNEHDH